MFESTTARPRSVLGRVLTVLLASLMLAALLPGAVLGAAPTITPATGGSAISADSAALPPGTNTYDTTLAGPSLDGSIANPIVAGTWTLTISGPFAFQPALGSASLSGAGCATLSLGSGATVVAGSASVTTTGASTGVCSIVYSGLKVHPTLGAPVAGSIDSTGLATGAAGTLTEVAGAAILSFLVAPSPTTVTAGVNFTTSPTIRSQDRFSNPRTGDSITLATVPATTWPACTANPVTTAAGNAVFTSCHIDTAGSFVLRASGAGASVDFGTAITVNPGTATKLVFTTQPARGTPSGSFAVQPVVSIEDALNNVVTTASASVTLAIGTNPGGGGTTILCTTNPLTTTSGVASFSACRINNVGVGYTLTASDGGALADPTSAVFDVADRVVFTTQPSGAVAGTAFTTQPVVAVRAGASNTAVNDSTTSVTLSLSGGPIGATLTGCTSNPLTVSVGVASFAGCKIDKVGTYTLIASATNLLSATSTSFTVVAGPAVKLGFTAQPTSATANQAFPIQPIVAIQDAGGNTVTGAAAIVVTLAIGSNPAGGTLTCTSGNTRTTFGGVATFAGCAINNAGAGYTLTATGGVYTSATGTAFTVTAPAATITLTTSAPVITWGSGILLGVQFGTNGAGKTFQLQAARDGVTWVTIATLTTNVGGSALLAYRPPNNNYYRAVFLGTPDLLAANSATVRTVVRQIALLRPTNHGAIRVIRRGTSITFTTTVRPSRPELPTPQAAFRLFRRVGGAWLLVSERVVAANSAGQATTTFRFSTTGSWYVRSRANPTPYNANSFWSPVEQYSVR